MSRDTISLFFTGMLVVCALIVTGLVVKREFFNQSASSPEIRFIEDWKQVAANGNVIGPQNAPVKIVEFFDYQCPFCGQLEPRLEKIRQRYPEKVALVARHFPLPNHRQALPAARAAECAAEQGRFASYHDLLFAHQDRLGTVSWTDLARQTGVENIEAFKICINGKRVNAKISRDVVAARKLGINSVPTLIVNGQMVSGAVSLETLNRMVREALGEVES